MNMATLCSKLTCLDIRRLSKTLSFTQLLIQLEKCNDCSTRHNDQSAHKTRNILGAEYVEQFWMKDRRK
jgi:hypothetical protein